MSMPKTVVEQQGEDDFLVMLPDGEVKGAGSVAEAQRINTAWCKRRAKRAPDGVLVSLIEWRNLSNRSRALITND